MDICVVCLENNGGISRIHVNSKKWKESNMQHIIEKHLWWWFLRQPLNNDHRQWICQQCWLEITSFHQYAKRVKRSHKLYRVSMKKQCIQVVNEAEPNQMDENEMDTSTTAQESIEPSPITTEERLPLTTEERLPLTTEERLPLTNIRRRQNVQIEEINAKNEQCYDMTDDNRLHPVHENEVLPNLECSVSNFKDPLQNGNKQTHILTDNKSLGEIRSLLQQQNTLNRQIFNQINELKNIVGKQNAQITNVLSNQIASLKTSVTSHFEAPKFTTLFPISTEEELYAFESMITQENQSEVVSSVKRVIGNKGIEKGICHIFSNELMFEYNVDGKHGKKRLLDYEKTFNVLFLASSDDDTSLVEFNIQLRKAIKIAKNRYFKAERLKRIKFNETNDTTFEIFEEDKFQPVKNEPGCSPYN